MDYFELVVTLLSFVYALAVAVLLQGVADLLLARSRVRFSLLHAIWMVLALMLVFFNWHSLWNAHDQEITALRSAREFVFAGLQFMICALVAPRVPNEGGYDMRQHHAQHVRLYASVGALTAALAVIFTVQDFWREVTQQELLLAAAPTLISLLFLLLAAWRRERAIQFVCAIVLLLLMIAPFLVFG